LGSAVFGKAHANCFGGNSTAFLWQTLFGSGQTFTRNFQIIVAIAKFNEQFSQGNQMFHLETQRATAAAAHGFQFRTLFFGHADVELECFFRHTRSVPDGNFELMAKYD
jgi:hypothetical protein